MTSPAKHNLLSWALGLCALALLSWSHHVLADARVVVRPFSGPGGAAVHAAVERELKKHGIDVVQSESAERVAKRRGVKVDGSSGRKEIARELELNAWVEGRVRKHAGKLEATITVRDGRANQDVGSTQLKRKKAKQLDQAVKQQLWRELGSAIESAQGPDAKESASEPEPEPEPESNDLLSANTSGQSAVGVDDERVPGFASNDEERIDGEQDEPKRPREVSALEAAFTMNTLHRTMVFTDALTQGLGDYALASAPMVDVGLRVYPGAFLKSGWPSYIGVAVHGQTAFAVKSRGSDGTDYPTSYNGFGGGIVGRYPIKEHEVNGILGYDAQSFRVNNAKGGQPAPVPDVSYQMVRFGIGGKVSLMDRLKLGMEAAWLAITAKGELASSNWFPRASGSGIEGALYADVRLYGALDARARFAYQRDFFSFHSQPGDKHVAGGAVDSYVSGGLGVAYTY